MFTSTGRLKSAGPGRPCTVARKRLRVKRDPVQRLRLGLSARSPVQVQQVLRGCAP